jgi:hypothetical protein
MCICKGLKLVVSREAYTARRSLEENLADVTLLRTFEVVNIKAVTANAKSLGCNGEKRRRVYGRKRGGVAKRLGRGN